MTNIPRTECQAWYNEDKSFTSAQMRQLLCTPLLFLLAAGCNPTKEAPNTSPPPPVSQIQQSSQNIFAQDEFARWNTYRNEEYGFEVQYPAGWFADEWDARRYSPSGTGTNITFCPGPGSCEQGWDALIGAYERTDKETVLKSWISDADIRPNPHVQKSTYAGHDAIIAIYGHVLNETTVNKAVIFEASDRTFVIAGILESKSETLKDRIIIERILDTFKLTNQ